MQMTKQAELIAHVFDGQPHPLSAELLQWMEESARFTAFVETYRDKVRKKVRVTRQEESILDLRGELEVAYRLLNDRRLSVAYEPYASTGGRGPDFAVTYRANLRFNVEAARMRTGEAEDSDLARHEERFLRILLYKLGQMQPGMANLLVLQTGEEVRRAIDLDGLMQAIKRRAEGKEVAFYAGSGYSGPAAFYKDFLRLSGVVLWAEGAQAWANRQARLGLEERLLRLVSSLLSGASRQEGGKVEGQ
jgi:hypothetical protein